jgi:superfamily II DNA or RNA helicase
MTEASFAAYVRARLEDLTTGAVVRGIASGRSVTVVQVARHGPDVCTVTYRDEAGGVDERLLYRSDEPGLLVARGGGAFGFNADGHLFRLVSEAQRIRLAYLFDPMLAVSTSALEPLPHQIQAVYGEMLPRLPLRFLLADDPGAGKTIMAGLYMKELMLRGDVGRCLVVAPGSLNEQWQDELADKFGLHFELLTREMVEASRTGNPFAERDLLIARMHQVSRSDELIERLRQTDWDLVVVDEAHKMSAHFYGNDVEKTKLYRLGEVLGSVARHFLLMTATPHAGKEEDFQLFMALLDADRFEGKPRDAAHGVATSDLMRRMIKERLLTFDGKPLFPERRAYTVPYPLTEAERLLYDEVTRYVTEGMDRAERLVTAGHGRRGNTVGFALTLLQRRLASSPEAIYRSLQRRYRKLSERLAEVRAIARGETRGPDSVAERLDRLLETRAIDDDALEDLSGEEREQVEDEVLDAASAATSIPELEGEIADLEALVELARSVRRAGTDRKWAELSSLLSEEPELRNADGTHRKLIVFTEHRDTLSYLVERLRTLFGRVEAVVDIYGGVRREERRRRQEFFAQDKGCQVLVATDAAGEGINLQCAHLLVNYDLPWNPNRIEQRFGRVHRIGQTEVCHMWNLIAAETREGQVYQRLLEKVEEQRQAYGGEVFDVLGQAFADQPLKDLLIKAIRYGDRPDVRAQLDRVIDAAAGDGVRELVAAQALHADMLGVADVERLRLQLEEAQARRLQPHYIQALFALLGGRMHEREPARFEVTYVPAAMRHRDSAAASGRPLLARYQRICFDKPLVRMPGRPPAELIAPGHPLLDVTVDMIRERYGELLRSGTVLVDESDQRDVPRAVIYCEHRIADGRRAGDSRPLVVSQRLQFVAVEPDGQARDAGPAPYLDLRPTDPNERQLLDDLLTASWLREDLAEKARTWVITTAAPAHLNEVRESTLARVGKVRAAVRERLLAEIEYWYNRANELSEQALLGKQPRMNPDRARSRAEVLEERLSRRLAQLDAEVELQALPPVVVGAALVVPAGLLARLREQPTEPWTLPRETAEVDRRAVDAVLAAEGALGREPEEMPHTNPGYDIRSRTHDGHWLFLEVKGRLAGSDTVSVSRTQILTGLNVPDRFVLALVSVSPDSPARDEVRYVRRPFEGMTFGRRFAETKVVFDWEKLWSGGTPPT